ncbi:MAG TPA: hypothetical protein VNA29_07895 [Sphingomicrobium sp.]|nr:hypothetical protein [Sphingomicrobium sp.]
MDEQLINPARPGRIMQVALAVGGIAFAAGFVGPLIFSDSNLGPLLGIFVTGPLGFLAGGLIGVVLSARRGRPEDRRQELRWLAAAWLLSLLFTLASIGGIGWIAIGTQAAVIITASYVFYGGKLPKSEVMCHYRLPLLVAGVVALLSSAFPPAKSNDGEQRFAIFLDPRFDASRNVPEFTVDASSLALGWLVLLTIALAAGYAAQSWANRRRQF